MKRHSWRVWGVDDRIQLILEEIDNDDRVLDVGCVHERDAFMKRQDWLHGFLYKKAKYVLGIDIVEEEVEKLRNKGYNVIVANAEEFNLKERFDVIVAGEIIEHLSNPGKFLDRAYDHLTMEGKLIITVPNAWCWLNFLQALYKSPTVNEEHTCWYDEKTLSQLLNRHRFKIQKLLYVKGPLKARGAILSRLLYNLGFKRIGALGLLVVAEKQKPPART